MDDRPERDLAGLDVDRPLPPSLFARLESALLDDALARAAHAAGENGTAAMFDGLDAPRALPSSTRAALEQALVHQRPDRRGRGLLAVAAALLLVVGTVAALRLGRTGAASNDVASGPPRSVPAAGVPPVLQAPPTTEPPTTRVAAPSTTRPPRTTSTTLGCEPACPLPAIGAASGAASGGSAGAAGPMMPAPPYVSGVDPSTGPTAGGTTVTVRGAGFTGATGVLFGSTPAPTFTVISDDEIRTISPPSLQPQAVVVSVTFPGGWTSTPTGSDSFTYT